MNDKNADNPPANASLSSSAWKHHKVILFTFIMIIIALVTDTSLVRISDLLTSNLSRDLNLAIFVLISAVCIAGQFIILRIIRFIGKDIRTEEHWHLAIYRIATAIIQYGLVGVLLFAILQLIVTSQYATMTLILATTLSYAMGAAMMALLAKHFVSWFRSNRDLMVLLYGLSAVTLAVHLAFTLFFVDYVLSGLPGTVRTPFSSPPFLFPGSIKFALSNIYTVTSIVSFAMTWIATILLLYHYSHRLGQLRYWVIVSLPLIYFLSQFPSLFLNVFGPLIKQDPIFYGTLLTLIFTLSKPAGGILFGVAFWTTAKRIRSDLAVRDYLIISAYGFILLFTCEQAIVLINATYPPFGLATVSFMGLSTYLVFVGIYYSAVSVSQDNILRQEIKKFADQESKLLDHIGSAQMEKDIQSKLTAIMENQDIVNQRTGVQSSLDEDDLLEYLDEVLKEKKLSRKDHDNKGVKAG